MITWYDESMFEITTSDAKNFSASNRLIVSSAVGRGWRVYAYDLPASHMYIDRGDGQKIHIYSSCPPSVSYADAIVSNDKWLTYLTLQAYSITQLKTAVLTDIVSQKEMENILKSMGKLVVKPRDGAHGKGITIGVETTQGLQKAINYAMRYNTNASSVIVQEQFEGGNNDLRLLCIDGEFKAAIHRVPARVYGDGLCTVRELIDIENAKKDRGIAYKEKFAYIDKERAEAFLGETIDNIPDKDQEVTVLGVANYGAGGETIDVTDDIPEWLRTEAEKATTALGLSVAGVDYIATGSKTIAKLEANSKDAVLIEVNKAPSLCIHDEPTHGKNRHTTEAYLDLITPL